MEAFVRTELLLGRDAIERLQQARVAMSCFTACRLEVPMPSRLWDIFSVIRQAHWMNSRSLYRFQAMMSFSFTQYRGRISSIPGKLVLWSLGIIPWICPP